MSAQKIASHEPSSPAWHDQRRTALGGSEIAAVLGLSPFESRFALWHRKAGIADPVADAPEMEWGRRLESAIAQKWLDEHAATHGDYGTGETFMRDGWKIASPDLFVAQLAVRGAESLEVVEVKHPLYDDGWGPSGTDQVPVYYLTQARWYLHVLGLRRCHFAVLIGACDYREYTVEQDDSDIELMVREGRAFLDSIAAGVRPDIDGSDATYQVVRRLHPDIDPEHVELDPDLARALIQADQMAKRAAEVRQAAISEALDAMGRAKHGDVEGFRIAYRTAKTLRDGTPGVPYLQIDKKAAGHLALALTERTAS